LRRKDLCQGTRVRGHTHIVPFHRLFFQADGGIFRKWDDAPRNFDVVLQRFRLCAGWKLRPIATGGAWRDYRRGAWSGPCRPCSTTARSGA
jgi:hypothetical protein